MAKVTKRSKGGERQHPEPSVTNAPLAMTSNCILLININECEGRNLEGRERFVGVVATAEEALNVQRAAEDAFCDAASKLAAKLPLKNEARRRSRSAKAATS